MGSDAEEKANAKAGHPAPLLLIAMAALCLLLPGGDFGSDENAVPARITHVANAAGQDARPSTITPSLRGCCGTPTQFHWVFLDSAAKAIAGSPFRTRVFALDAQGRQARPSACGELRVDMGLSGRARLSAASSLRAWRNAELRLDIENDIAEVVEAEVRIENPGSNSDVLLHTSQIRFASGPVHTFSISVRHPGAELPKPSGTPQGASLGGPWPTKTRLQVVVSRQDRLGNPVSFAGQSLSGKLLLRSNSKSLYMAPTDGLLEWDKRTGDGHAFVHCSQAEPVEVWLELVGGNATRRERQAIHERTTRRLDFIDPPKPPDFTASGASATLSPADSRWKPVADEVRQAFLHAWRNYRKYAWGRDELQPLSKSGRDSFGGIGITIMDALTTLWLMGLSNEFEQATNWVDRVLDFDNADTEVSVFELIIRAVGGLLGAHSLSGRPIFLTRAKELAERLLPALNTSSNLPVPKWNIARGGAAPSTEPTILSEAGSMQLEFRYLTEHSGDKRFQRAGDACLEAIQKTGVTGLAPVYLTPPDHAPPRALASKFAVGALADSYYEYLLKLWLQNSEEVRFKDLWLLVLDEVPGLLRPRPQGPRAAEKSAKAGASGPKFKLVEVASGGEPIWKMDHLSCFAAGMIALGLKSLPAKDLREKGRNVTWWPVAEGLTASCSELWTSSRSGLSPEFAVVRSSAPFDFKEVPEAAHHSFLRPETVESLFYMYRFTGDEKYRKTGEKIFRAIMENGKVEGGFASVKDVNQVPTEKIDEMQSFVMAETFKYLFLLFSPADTLDLDRYVLNTEGHPLRKFRVP